MTLTRSIFIVAFLGKLYMSMLKQMGGCFALIGKKATKLPLYKEQTLYLEEMKPMELMLINHAHVKLYNSQEDKELINKTNTHGCCIERCNNIIDFLLLTKHDFI